MATSVVHFLTIVGEKPASEVEAACEALLAARLELCRRDPEECADALDWSNEDEPNLKRFSLAMLDRAYELPVYAYSQYVENYSMANFLLRELNWPDDRTRAVGGLNNSTAWCRSADYAHHRGVAKRALRRRRLNHGYRSFHTHLQLAMESVLYGNRASLVLILYRCIGSTREGFEVDAAMIAPLGVDLLDPPGAPV